MKGLAIMGVVLGHCAHCDIRILEIFVNYWHLPAFYFVSGYFMKEKALTNGKQFFISRFNRLIIPWILYTILALLVHNTLLKWGFIEGAQYHLKDFLVNPRLILHEGLGIFGALWFLPSLFIVSTITWLLAKVTLHKKSIYFILGGVIISFVGLVLHRSGINSLFNFFANMAISWICMFGYLVRKQKWENILNNKYLFILSLIVLLITLSTDTLYGCQGMQVRYMPLWFPIIFIAGIVFIYTISSYLEKFSIRKPISIIGNNSFTIMAWHFLAFKIVTAIHKIFDNSVQLISFPTDSTDIYIWAPIYFIAGVLIPLLIAWIYDLVKQQLHTIYSKF